MATMRHEEGKQGMERFGWGVMSSGFFFCKMKNCERKGRCDGLVFVNDLLAASQPASLPACNLCVGIHLVSEGREGERGEKT